MSRQYCVTCQVSIVARVKSLSESQFIPYMLFWLWCTNTSTWVTCPIL